MAIQRGEVYCVNLNPVLVLSIDAINRLRLVVTVVVGTKGSTLPRDYPTNVRVPPAECGLPVETVFLGSQVRSLDPARFPAQPAGRISPGYLRQIEGAVRYCFSVLALNRKA